jgi:two-component system, NarL family, invasion response regulator UvrY
MDTNSCPSYITLEMIHAIICDDHPLFREGVKKAIGAAGDIVMDDVSTGAELRQKLDQEHFDVVVLDISLPDASGLDLLKAVQGMPRAPAVIMLSMHPEEQYAVRSLRAGASGYLEKASGPAELIAAIRRTAHGGRYVSESLAERLASTVGGKADVAAHERLSDREYQVMRMLAAGKGTKDIAATLFLAPTTIGTYRARILQKLGLASTAELIRYAVTNHLVD